MLTNIITDMPQDPMQYVIDAAIYSAELAKQVRAHGRQAGATAGGFSGSMLRWGATSEVAKRTLALGAASCSCDRNESTDQLP